MGIPSSEAETGEIPRAECFRLLHSTNKAEYRQSPTVTWRKGDFVPIRESRGVAEGLAFPQRGRRVGWRLSCVWKLSFLWPFCGAVEFFPGKGPETWVIRSESP